MSVVTYFVETAESYLNTAAETQFGSVAATVGTLIQLSATVLLIFVLINMAYQYRSMDGRQAFWLCVKIVLIGIFATNWTQFNSVSAAILNGIDSIAGSLVASVGGGTPGPSGTFAEEFDELINTMTEYLNAAGAEMSWFAGALIDAIGFILLSLLGALAAFILVASRLMITLLIGLAPIMIFLTMFEVTKDYFARWLSSLISFAIYPVIVAGVFATIVGVASDLISRLGDPSTAVSIGSLVPFFMMILMAKGFIVATPFIVRAISGNIVMPALLSGLGGAYDVGRGMAGTRMARNREAYGSASAGERAGLMIRGAGARAITTVRSTVANKGDNPDPPSPNPPAPTGTGQRMMEAKARSERIRDAGRK